MKTLLNSLMLNNAGKYVVMFLASCALLETSSAVGEVKIATVDVARIINESPVAQEKKKELNKASDAMRKKLEAKATSLKETQEKLEKRKVAADSKEAESFRKEAKEFERLRDDLKADLEKKYVRINKEVSDSVMKAVEKFAKANNYDLIIDKSEKYQGPILYGTKAVDVTDKIIDEIS